MNNEINGSLSTTQTTHHAIQRNDLVHAGEEANRLAAEYSFADYHQRRAQKRYKRKQLPYFCGYNI